MSDNPIPTMQTLSFPVPRMRYRGPRESLKWNVAVDALTEQQEQCQSCHSLLATHMETDLEALLANVDTLALSVIARRRLQILRQAHR